MWMAGGGVRGGKVIGSTDEIGLRAVESPVHVHDLHATILQLLKQQLRVPMVHKMYSFPRVD